MLTGLVGLLAAAIVGLPAGVDVDYQLGGASTPAPNVGIVERDRTDPPAAGVYNICYVNGFQTQTSERAFWLHHTGLLLHDRTGHLVIDENWGEWLLDLRTPAQRKALAAIMGRWTQGCAAAGYAAVEYDNLDSFTRSDGLISRHQALTYAAILVRVAHHAGLAVAQKNLAGYDGTRIGFDFAISEECGRYNECQRYVDHYGDAVLMIEYRQQDFAKTCAAYGATHAVELRDVDLTPSGVHQWC